MNTEINVLAVLDEFALYVRNVSYQHALQGDITEARAAVADLIEAARNSAENMGWEESHPVCAALARVGGAS